MTKDLNHYFSEGLARAAGDDALTDGRDLVAASARSKARSRRTVRASGLSALAVVAMVGVGFGSFTLVDQRNSANSELPVINPHDLPTSAGFGDGVVATPQITTSPGVTTEPIFVADSAVRGDFFVELGDPVAKGSPLAGRGMGDFPVYRATDDVLTSMGIGWSLWVHTPESSEDSAELLYQSPNGIQYLAAILPPRGGLDSWSGVARWHAEDRTAVVFIESVDWQGALLVDLATGKVRDIPVATPNYANGPWGHYATMDDGTEVWAIDYLDGSLLHSNLTHIEKWSPEAGWSTLAIDYVGLSKTMEFSESGEWAVIRDYGVGTKTRENESKIALLPKVSVVDVVNATRKNFSPLYPAGVDTCDIVAWADAKSFRADCFGSEGRQDLRVFFDGKTAAVAWEGTRDEPASAGERPNRKFQFVAKWNEADGGERTMSAKSLNYFGPTGPVQVVTAENFAQELDLTGAGAVTSFTYWGVVPIDSDKYLVNGEVNGQPYCLGYDSTKQEYSISFDDVNCRPGLAYFGAP